MSAESAQATAFDDPILALHSEATQRRRSGESIIDATVGVLMTDDGALAVLPSAARAIAEVSSRDWATYAPILGRADFLAAVSADLLSDGVIRRAAVTVATPGGTGALHVAIAHATRVGDSVLTTAYHWPAYQTLCTAQGRSLTTYPMFDAAGRWNAEGLESGLRALLSRQGRALLIINDPCHNPTGYTMTDGDWSALVELIARRSVDGEISVVLDLAYAGFAAADGARAVEQLARMRANARPFIAWSASKLFTMYGLRVGALVALCRDEEETRPVTHAMSNVCRGTWSNCNHGGMAAVARLMIDPDLRASVDSERLELVSVLATRGASFLKEAQRSGLATFRYSGGFFITVACDEPIRAAGRLRERGMFVVPQPRSLRVALSAVATQDVPRLVRGLAEAR